MYVTQILQDLFVDDKAYLMTRIIIDGNKRKLDLTINVLEW